MIRQVLAAFRSVSIFHRPPAISEDAKVEIEKSFDEIIESFPEGHKRITALPKTGWKIEVIQKRMEKLSRYEIDKKSDGKFSGKNFDVSSDVVSICEEGSGRFLFCNLLFFFLHASSIQIDNEVISMCLRLLGGKGKCRGVTTMSVLESHCLIVLAYKRFMLHFKGVTEPELVLADTAHPSFFKACEMMDVRPIVVKTDPQTKELNSASVKQKISASTILVVCSAPNSLNGVIDPVEDIARVCTNQGVFLHVDATMGGFILPFLEQAGVSDITPKFDFRVEGVSSMSLDLGTYGGAPANISAVIYADERVQKSMYWGTSAWSGYLYVCPTFLGSKCCNFIAAAWGAMLRTGTKGYTENAKLVVEGTKNFLEKFASIGDLKIIGNPKVGLVAFKSATESLNIFHLGCFLEKNGWNLEPALGSHALQLLIHKNNAHKLKELIQLIKRGCEEIKKGQHTNLQGRWVASCKLAVSWKKNPALAEELAREYSHKFYTC